MPTNKLDVSAIEALYASHHGWLTAWLRGKSGVSAHAADLAQDTFVRVLRKPDDLNGVREPRAWLRTIAQGLVIDHVRRMNIERAYLDAIAHLPPASMPGPETRLTMLETLVSIDALLADLPTKARQAFLMSRLEEMRYQDIAQVLNVSLSSVEKYMATAVRHCYDRYRAHRAACQAAEHPHDG